MNMTTRNTMEKTHDRALRMTLDLVLQEGSTEADELRVEAWAVAQVKELMEEKGMTVEKVSARPMWRERE